LLLNKKKKNKKTLFYITSQLDNERETKDNNGNDQIKANLYKDLFRLERDFLFIQAI